MVSYGWELEDGLEEESWEKLLKWYHGRVC